MLWVLNYCYYIDFDCVDNIRSGLGKAARFKAYETCLQEN